MTIFVDISELYKVNFISGIQRVVIEVLTRWIESGEKVKLGVYYPKKKAFRLADNSQFYEFYKNGSSKKQYLTNKYLPVTDIDSKFIFYDMDSVWMNMNKRSYLLPLLRAQGAGIAVHIYDIIPVTEPQYCHELTVLHFIDYLAAYIENADLIITNADATVAALKKITEGIETGYRTAVVKLGSDVLSGSKDSVNSSVKLPQRTQEIIERKPYILMVGTLEPRKNHAYVLDSFDRILFNEGFNLVFAGRRGWNIDDFIDRIHNHPLFNKQLFFVEGGTDKEIRALYENAFFVAFASFNEGFGLPIIEAFSHGTPVLASDIPVLRETGGEYADYFSLDNSDDFIDKVNKYRGDRDLYEAKKTSLQKFSGNSWDECAAGMMKALKDNFSDFNHRK